MLPSSATKADCTATLLCHKCRVGYSADNQADMLVFCYADERLPNG